MTFLFIIIIIAGLYIIGRHAGDARSMPTQEKEWTCANPPKGKSAGHKWVMKVQPDHYGYLICKICGKMPGDDI